MDQCIVELFRRYCGLINKEPPATEIRAVLLLLRYVLMSAYQAATRRPARFVVGFHHLLLASLPRGCFNQNYPDIVRPVMVNFNTMHEISSHGQLRFMDINLQTKSL